ncbi:CBS domain-containing protein [Porticoccaceae bacterium]|nr:CBS domain-containing protein [Porticoccaceae bacterium]
MKNSEIFLDEYNKIDKFLNQDSRYVSFAEKVRASKNNIVRNYRDELLTFAELRNAIVHSPRIQPKSTKDSDDAVIAEPHGEVVANIRKIYRLLTDPPKVFPRFKCDVLGAKRDEFINGILVSMKKHSFSQFPVFSDDGLVEELITTNTISRWLSSNIDPRGEVIVEGVTVDDLIPEIEHKKNYKFISRHSSIFDVHQLFANHPESRGNNLDAIFVTESGRAEEKVLGVLTIEDVSTTILRE